MKRARYVYLIKVTLNYSYVASERLEIVIDLLRAEISSAQDVLNLARDLRALSITLTQ